MASPSVACLPACPTPKPLTIKNYDCFWQEQIGVRTVLAAACHRQGVTLTEQRQQAPVVANLIGSSWLRKLFRGHWGSSTKTAATQWSGELLLGNPLHTSCRQCPCGRQIILCATPLKDVLTRPRK